MTPKLFGRFFVEIKQIQILRKSLKSTSALSDCCSKYLIAVSKPSLASLSAHTVFLLLQTYHCHLHPPYWPQKLSVQGFLSGDRSVKLLYIFLHNRVIFIRQIIAISSCSFVSESTISTISSQTGGKIPVWYQQFLMVSKGVKWLM